MKDITTLTDDMLVQAGRAAPVREASMRTRKLFVLLHGFYGSGFLAKFATGQLVEQGPKRGQDMGVLTAMLVWDADLAPYTDDVLLGAAERLKRESTEFAPNLAQFTKVCEAITPRKSYAEEAGLLALPAPVRPVVHPEPFEPQHDGKDWARGLKARHEAGDYLTPFQVDSYRDVLGIPKPRKAQP